MAEENIVIDISTRGGASIDKAKDSYSKLKAELKAAQAAALNGDGAAARRVAELRDRVEDLRDATRSLQGSGIERTQNSFKLLGEGLMNMDFDKIKTAFKGLGAAMKAIPIFLLIEGVKYLVENFDSLSKGSGPLAKILRAVGDALGWIGDKIGNVVNFFTDMAGATSDATRALEKQGEAIKKNAETLNNSLQSQIKNFDNQMAIAKAAGESTVKLEKEKQEAIVKTNLAIANQILAYVRAGGELDDEKKKQLTTSLEAIKAAKVQERVVEITDSKAKQEAYKKHLEEMKKIREEREAEERAAKLELDKRQEVANQKVIDDFIKVNEAEINANHAKNDELIISDQQKLDTQAAIDANYKEIQAQKNREFREKELAEELAQTQARLDMTRMGLQGGQDIADIFFAVKMAKVKKGSAEEESLARRQFEINKKFQEGLTAVQGIQNGIAAYGAGVKAASATGIGAAAAPAVGAAYAAISALGTLAALAKIRATQFGSSGGGGVDVGGGGTPNLNTGGVNTGAPTTVAPPVQRTDLDEAGNVIGRTPVVKAIVVETDITKSQDRVGRIDRQSTF